MKLANSVVFFHCAILVALALSREDKEGTTEKSACRCYNYLKVREFCNCLRILGGIDTKSKLVDSSSNSSDYKILNHQWNTRPPKVYPIAYFTPGSTEEVKYAVICGRLEDIQLVPNSGGHSYELLSYGGNNSLIIDFRLMADIQLSDEGRAAIIQPGALIGHVHAKLWELGRVGVPLGLCNTVGIGGHAIGGGIGYFHALYGLAIDNVMEYEMVDSKGNIVTANASHNSDLLWALRGVGAGYIGIVTRFKFKTFNVGSVKITMVGIQYPLKYFVKGILAVQEWIEWTRIHEPYIYTVFGTVADNYTTEFTYFGPPGFTGFVVDIVHVQDPDLQPNPATSMLKAIREIFVQDKLGIPHIMEFVPHNFIHLAVKGIAYYTPVNIPLANGTILQTGRLDNPAFDSDAILGLPPPGSPVEDYDSVFLKRLLSVKKEMAVERFYKAKSFYIKRNLTLEEIERMSQVLQKMPVNQAWLVAEVDRGRVATLRRTDTAFVHRDFIWNFCINIESIPEYGDVSGAMEWLDEFWTTVESFDGGESYQNYPDLEQEDHLRRNYAENLPRLVSLKRRWDPENYFRNKFSLPLTIIPF